MRYKCLEQWEQLDTYSRVLNGLFATLNTCDWTMIQLFNDISYRNYKEKNGKI